MFTKTFATIIAVLPFVAQAQAKVWDVTVGGSAGLVYTPPFVNAAVNDTVHFTFNAKNHTVTQSSFDAPCSPLLGGVNTGFNFPVDPSATSGFPTFDILVQNTEPFWIHCEQTGHCPMGMVFAINPPATGNTFDAFKAKALALAPASSTDGTMTATTIKAADPTKKSSAKWSKRSLMRQY
ncbi:hypothetical protein FRB95_013594 [Tulasnella sp. JGI-2019a]|nr:hypothetical protein FRB93_002206 [Tulasnella sp. JGI-2019a]KAG9038916.1 hypothetical protein FRB95_013594 [Tulasnella sp. JGI-2019a]